MDYAIIVISAVEGIEGHTETVWELLRKHQIPTFFFINKTDRVGADVDNIIKELELNVTEDIFDITNSFENGVIRNREKFRWLIVGCYSLTKWQNFRRKHWENRVPNPLPY